ncbi:MAG: sulfatase-like hydrolase/transferase [Clostridia bacterium]|nr:sulfatase-like hydrolase/transferase [Clostridia bacterium]
MKKQIVLIMTDTQRWDMVNCYRNTGLQTPNIDEMAASGMMFTNAYTCQPVCGPARSAIFTGTFPHSNGVCANSMPLGDNVKTIGQRLRDQGIKTAFIGKWHLDGSDYFGLGRCPDGWDKDYWYDMKNYLEEMSAEDRLKSRDMFLMDKENVQEVFTFGYKVAEKAIAFIKAHHDEDFLLCVSFDEPHHPFLCPKEYYDLFENYEFPKDDAICDDLSQKSPHYALWANKNINLSKKDVSMNFQAFFGCNSFVDHLIGKVYRAVNQFVPEALGIYTSDHGDALYSHKITSKGPSSYDCISKIPLMIWQKNKIEKNSRYVFPASHIDIVPTILDFMNISLSKVLEGKSMLPALYHHEKINDEIFLEYSRYEIDHDGFGGYQPMRAVFDGRYKLTVFLLGSDELYDLKNDPDELDNLIYNEQLSETRNKLHDRLLDWMNNTRDPFRGYYWERRDWRKDAAPASWDYTLMTRQREDEYEPRQLDYLTGLEIEEATRLKE